MRYSITNYIERMDNIIMSQDFEDIDLVIESHLNKIRFFQHERLVHLLVTMLISLLTMITFLFTIKNFSLGFFVLTILFICLLVPYIIHYYFLENGVQYMYKQYERLESLKEANM